MGKGGKGPPPHVRAFRSHSQGGGIFADGSLDLEGLHRTLNDPMINKAPDGCGKLLKCGGGVDGFSNLGLGFGAASRASPLGGKAVSMATARTLFQAFDLANNGVIEMREWLVIFELMSVPADDWEFAMNERRKKLGRALRDHAARLGLEPSEPLPRETPLARFYARDAVVMTAATSPRARAARACLTAPLKLFGIPFPCVCFWPHGVIFFGAPCAFIVKPCWVYRAAKATTLELRERRAPRARRRARLRARLCVDARARARAPPKCATRSSLFSTTEPYVGWSPFFGPPCVAPLSTLMQCCCAPPLLCSDENGVQERQAEVIPLELVDGARVESHAADASVYTCDSSTPSVVVTAFGGRTVAVVDGVRNADEFVAAVEARKGARARRPLDDATRAQYAHYLMGSWLRLDATRHGGVLDVSGAAAATAAPPAVMMAQVIAAQPTIMQVQVPPGAGPGAAMLVQAPDGRQIQVEVPPGAAAGSVFQVQVPPAAMEMERP